MFASKIRKHVRGNEKATIEDIGVCSQSGTTYSVWFSTSDGTLHKTSVFQRGAKFHEKRSPDDEATFRISTTRPSSLCMSPDRRFLLVGLMDGQLVAVDADLHSSTMLGHVRSGAPIASIVYDDHYCCFWVCSADLAITAWDANTLLPLCSISMQPPEELRREDPFAARVRLMNRLIIVSTGTALLNAMLPQQCIDALEAPRPQRQNLSSAAIHIVDDWFPHEASYGEEASKGEEDEDRAERLEGTKKDGARQHSSSGTSNKAVYFSGSGEEKRANKGKTMDNEDSNDVEHSKKRAWWKGRDKSILDIAWAIRGQEGGVGAGKGTRGSVVKVQALRNSTTVVEGSKGKEGGGKQQQHADDIEKKKEDVAAAGKSKERQEGQKHHRRQQQRRGSGVGKRTDDGRARLTSRRERHCWKDRQDSHMVQGGEGAEQSRAVHSPVPTQLHTLFRQHNMAVHVFALGRAQEVWCGSHVSACLFVYDIGMRKMLLSWLLPCTGITAIAHHSGSMWVGTKEGTTYAWDAHTHAPLMQISFHTDMVRCFSGIDHVLVSGSGSGDSSIVVCNTRELLKRKRSAVAASSAVVDGNAAVPEVIVDMYGFYRFHVRTTVTAPSADDACMRAPPADVARDFTRESFVTKHSVLLEKATVSLEGIGMSDAWDELCAYARARSLNESVSGVEVDQIHAIIMEKKHMFRLGIPEEHRVAMWRFLVRLRTHSNRKFKKAGYYERMLEYKGTSQTPFPQAGQIEVDLRRTFPNNIHFQSKHQPLMQALDRVLRAFGWHNPRVGYCQGLGQLTAFASLILEEEDTFWALTAIVEDIMTPNYYCAPLLQAHVDMDALKELVAHYIPSLHIHFHAVGLLYQVFLKWFMTAFVNVLPAFVTLRIWDVFLVEGREILFRFALAILKQHEAQLLKLDDDDACYSYIKTEVPNTTNVDTLLKIAYAFEDLPECLTQLMGALTPAIASRLGSESS